MKRIQKYLDFQERKEMKKAVKKEVAAEIAMKLPNGGVVLHIRDSKGKNLGRLIVDDSGLKFAAPNKQIPTGLLAWNKMTHIIGAFV